MRRVILDELKGDEKLGRPIYTMDDQVLLSKGVLIKPIYIHKLKEMGIEYVYIDDVFSEDIEVTDFMNEQTRRACKIEVKKVITRYANTGKAEIGRIVKVADAVIEDILKNKEILVNLEEIRSQSEANYDHNVAVCGLAVLLSIQYGYTPEKAKDLAVGAMLHDLGKAIIPEEILNKVTPLSEAEMQQIKSHPVHGYEAVKNEVWLSAISKVVILTHHERLDGSGYPFGWTGEKIHDSAKIVAICDVFDAMTQPKPYRPAYKVYEAIEYLTAMKHSLFDGPLVDLFMKHVAAFPSGTGVCLNDGNIGIVVRQNAGLPTRPVVRMIKDSKGDTLDKFYEINLAKEHTKFILDTVSL